MRNGNRRTRNRSGVSSRLNEVLQMEKRIERMVARVPKTNRRAGSKRAKATSRGGLTAQLSPVAIRAFKAITDPTGPLQLHWPGGARDSLKFCARIRTTVANTQVGSTVIFPMPGVSNGVVSYVHMQHETARIWDLTGSNWGSPSGIAVTALPFSELPFSMDALTDGMSVRCLAYHVKLKYAGQLLDRYGNVRIYENPEKDYLSADNKDMNSSFNSFMTKQLNSPIHTRLVSFSDNPVIEHTFHPFMWHGADATPTSPDGWVRPQAGSSDSLSQPAYPAGKEVVDETLNSYGGRAYVGNGYITIEGECSVNIEVVAHYEFAGGAARPMSTPTPSAPHEDITHVAAAVLKGKMKHCLSGDGHIQELATDALKEIVGAKAAAVSEGVASRLLPKGSGATLKAAAGIAGLLL